MSRSRTAEEMDVAALRLRERLFYWTLVASSFLLIGGSYLISSYGNEWAPWRSSRIDPDAVAAASMFNVLGLMLALSAFILRWRTRSAWVIGAFLLLVGGVRLAYLVAVGG